MITPYRVVVSLLLAVAAAALYIAFLSAKEPEPSIERPSEVVAYSPAENSTVLRQSRIVAQLKPTLIGVLQIDGVEIPEDQLDHLEGVNYVGYTPRADTETGELTPGRHCATVLFWTPEAGRTTANSFNWCWQVH